MELESLHSLRRGELEMTVAIDSTRLGPALGGCRWRPYPNALSARREAASLARAMTRKAAMARLSLGGGKAVVNGDPARRTRSDLLAFGELVESLDGAYVTAADMGTGEAEMCVIAEVTRHVVGLPREAGGCGDPAPFTAEGVLRALCVALASLGEELPGTRVLVQGVGSVGSALIRFLCAAGSEVLACDLDAAALEPLSPEVARIDPGAALSTPCDVFSPCGPARVIDAASAGTLPARVVCGAANNPLRDAAASATLAARDILYVPDFVANAGGLMHLASAREGGDEAATRARLRVIEDNVRDVLALAKEAELNPAEAAEELARQRLEA